LPPLVALLSTGWGKSCPLTQRCMKPFLLVIPLQRVTKSTALD